MLMAFFFFVVRSSDVIDNESTQICRLYLSSVGCHGVIRLVFDSALNGIFCQPPTSCHLISLLCSIYTFSFVVSFSLNLFFSVDNFITVSLWYVLCNVISLGFSKESSVTSKVIIGCVLFFNVYAFYSRSSVSLSTFNKTFHVSWDDGHSSHCVSLGRWLTHVAAATTPAQVAADSIQINPCRYGKHDEMLRHLCNM